MCPLASIYVFMWGVYVVWVDIGDCSLSVKIFKFVTQKTRVSHSSGNNTRKKNQGMYPGQKKPSINDKKHQKTLQYCRYQAPPFYKKVSVPVAPKNDLDFGWVLEFFCMYLPPLNSLARFQQRNFRVQKRGRSRQKYPESAPFLFLACFSGF